MGLSRAKRGIVPSILKDDLDLEFSVSNLAFDGLHSPYGSYYSDFINRKLGKNRDVGLSILSVSPPSIMDRAFELKNGNREKDFFLYSLYSINSEPNIEYLFRKTPDVLDPKKAYTEENNKNIQTIFHDTGWWETTYASFREKKIKRKVGDRSFHKSLDREAHLERLILSLQNSEKLFLVRLPISKDNYLEEQKFYPAFDSVMGSLAEKHDIPYLNYSTMHSSFEFYDEKSHMDGKNARKFTSLLAKDIKAKL